MLVELVDHVVGVDPDRDWITLAVLDARNAGVVAEGVEHGRVACDVDGHRSRGAPRGARVLGRDGGEWLAHPPDPRVGWAEVDDGRVRLTAEGWLLLDRLAVGENTGNVVPSLKQIATAYQKQISNQLNMFTKVIASGVLMAVFIFVGFIAFAIVSAVFQVSGSFKMGG